jgi:hypothetical protein
MWINKHIVSYFTKYYRMKTVIEKKELMLYYKVTYNLKKKTNIMLYTCTNNYVNSYLFWS